MRFSNTQQPRAAPSNLWKVRLTPSMERELRQGAPSSAVLSPGSETGAPLGRPPAPRFLVFFLSTVFFCCVFFFFSVLLFIRTFGQTCSHQNPTPPRHTHAHTHAQGPCTQEHSGCWGAGTPASPSSLPETPVPAGCAEPGTPITRFTCCCSDLTGREETAASSSGQKSLTSAPSPVGGWHSGF